jgi:hypothetical protein
MTKKSAKEFIYYKKTNPLVIHYANWKPWNNNYIGKFYKEYKKMYNEARLIDNSISFLKRRNLFKMISLILHYVFRRKK